MTIGVKSIEPIVGELDIDESYIRQCDALLLETLLIDWTMTAENGKKTGGYFPVASAQKEAK